MNKIGVVVLFGLLAVSQAGCGSSDSAGGSGGAGTGGPPDFASLETTLTQPSGTFAAGQEGAVQDGFSHQAEQAEGNPFGGGSSSSSSKSFGAVSTANVDTLGGDGPCPQLKNGGKGSCACPNGGTLDFDIPANISGQPGQDPSGKIDQTVSIVAKTCGLAADQNVNGSIYWKIKNPPPMQLFAVHLKMTGKQTASWDVDYLNKNGVVTFAIEVSDGKVLVSAKGNWDKKTKTGTLVITDKNDTWTCVMTNGAGTCTSDKGVVRPVGGGK